MRPANGRLHLPTVVLAAFLPYCLRETLGRPLEALAPRASPRAARGRIWCRKRGGVDMLDVRVPSSEARELLLTRYTQREPERQLLLECSRLTLPAQLTAENHSR